MVFVDLRIFATRMAHVYVAGSTFHLKRRALLQTFSFSIERSYGEDGYRRERNDCTILPKTHNKIAEHISCLVRENCEGCNTTHLSQTYHTCLSMGKFKRLEYFDAALQRTLEARVMKTFTESLNVVDLSIHTEDPVKDWESVFCMEHQEALKQEILKIL